MKRVFAIYLFFQFFPGFSQVGFKANDSLNWVGEVLSDRPGHVMSARTCGFHVLQLQSGLRFQRYTYSPFPDDNSYSHYIIVPTHLRYGLTSRLEVNAGYQYYRAKLYNGFTNSTLSGSVSPGPIVGFRYTFFKGRKWIPTLALQVSMRFKAPKIELDFGSEYTLAINHDFGKLAVSSNIGLVWWGWDTWQYHKKPNYIPYAFKVSYDFGKITGFVEAFGDLTWPDLAIDGGLAIDLGKDFVLDFSGGCAEGIVISEYWFAEAGFTYRINFEE